MDKRNAWRMTWKLLGALAVGALLVMWFRVVHQDDEILALVRNEVAYTAAGDRTWTGSFVNTNDRTLRDVAVSVELLDSQDRAVRWKMGDKVAKMGPFREPWEFGYLMADPSAIRH